MTPTKNQTTKGKKITNYSALLDIHWEKGYCKFFLWCCKMWKRFWQKRH